MGDWTPCPACGGSGKIERVDYVTREMAMDSEVPEMEGMEQRGWERCLECGGSGMESPCDKGGDDETR